MTTREIIIGMSQLRNFVSNKRFAYDVVPPLGKGAERSFWCAQNCRGEWSVFPVTGSDKAILGFSFAHLSDATYFKLRFF